MLKLLVDADPLVYRSGFASQETVEDEYIGTAVRAQPVEFALHIVKTSIEAMQDAVQNHFGKSKIHTALVLSGPDNYRFKLATIRPYKGSRSPTLPVHYQKIRDYLTGQYGAKVVHRREADDEISIRAWRSWRAGERNYVVATVDKDLDQIPGWHYDYMKHVFYFVDEVDAQMALWRQILSGDPSDDVPGAWRFGPVSAKNAVDYCYENLFTPEQIWTYILDVYEQQSTLPGCPYVAPGRDAALETARLVYMQREPGELWNPPGVPMGKVEGDEDD